jgi:NAD(P)-dependent dehydrogenase (short-subunit alcohol dehydrogenase family)
MADRTSTTEAQPQRRHALSRRSLLGYLAAGAGLAAVGGGIVVANNRPAVSPRQQGLPRIPDWTAADLPPLQGRSALVTGANGYPEGDRSGLGFHVALELARAGADVTIASRRVSRGMEAVRLIQEVVPAASIRFETLDLSDLASVSAFTASMHQSRGSLDILVNNAGVMGRPEREASPSGFERVLATNTLGHFALTAGLLPLLQQGNDPRVVWVSSSRAFLGTVDLANLQLVDGYSYGPAYDNSKLANLLVAFEMQRRSLAEGWGIASIAAHPGIARTFLVPDGPGMDSLEGRNQTLLPFIFQPPAQGALPTLYAAASPQAMGGSYYGPNGPMELGGLPGWAGIPEQADDPQLAADLWPVLEQLCQVRFA